MPQWRVHSRKAPDIESNRPANLALNNHNQPGWKRSALKNTFLAVGAEFVGTFMFLFFGFTGTQAAKAAYSEDPRLAATTANPANPAILLYISLCFGFSLAVNVWIFYRVSGGLFNPAVTFGFMLVGAMSWGKGILLCLSQLVGAIAASAVTSAILPGPLAVSTTLASDMSPVRGLFFEMFLTSQLVLCIFLLAVEKHRATFIAPICIGLALFVTHLAGIFFTGASLNPARSLGPAVVTRSFPSYFWIYWVGPLLGAALAAGFYQLLIFVDYSTTNPGQDDDGRVNGTVEEFDTPPPSATKDRREQEL